MELFNHGNGMSCLYLFIGKSGSGKSVLIRWLLTRGIQEKRWGFGICFVATKFKHDFKWMPDNTVFEATMKTFSRST